MIHFRNWISEVIDDLKFHHMHVAGSYANNNHYQIHWMVAPAIHTTNPI